MFFNAKIFEKQKTSLRSPSLPYRVTASSPGRFDRKVGRDRKPQIFWFSSRVHWIFRFAGAPDFAVKSTRGACGHSRSQTRWSQARLSFFENLRIKKHSRLSDRSATSGVPLVGRVAQWPGLSKTQHFRVGISRTSKSVRPHCLQYCSAQSNSPIFRSICKSLANFWSK